MKRSKFTEEQITYALRQHDAGTPVGDICRQLGVSAVSFYVWKKKYAHMGVSELRELRHLLLQRYARLDLGSAQTRWLFGGKLCGIWTLPCAKEPLLNPPGDVLRAPGRCRSSKSNSWRRTTARSP